MGPLLAKKKSEIFAKFWKMSNLILIFQPFKIKIHTFFLDISVVNMNGYLVCDLQMNTISL